jgi:serine phosphatase RsbU (regulator of sigma subunit)
LLAFLAIDIATAGSRVNVTVLFAVAPLIACAALSPAWTAVCAVVSVTLAVAAGWWNDTWSNPQHYVRIADVAVISAVAVVIAAVRVRREQRMTRVLAIADAAQRAMLPLLPRVVNGVRLAARYESATEEALVGGDLYDLYHSDSVARVLIGDVRGKGLDGVAHAARVIRAFRQSAASGADLAEVAAAMNEYLLPFFGEEDFVTALLVEIHPDGRLVLVGCGHPPPFLVSQGKVTAVPVPAGLPLGLATTYTSVTSRWSLHDRLLLYTDGLIEARDARGRYLSQDVIAECLLRSDPEEALTALSAAVTAHVSSGRDDDLALVLVENLGLASYPAGELVVDRGVPEQVSGSARRPGLAAGQRVGVRRWRQARSGPGISTGRRVDRSTKTCTNQPVAAGWSAPWGASARP